MVPICSKKRKKSLAFLKVCIRGNFAESVSWVFSHFTKVSRSVCAHGSGNNVFSSRGTDFMFGLIRLIDLWDRGEEFLWNTKWNTSPDRFRHNYSSAQTNEHGGGIWPGYIEPSLGIWATIMGKFMICKRDLQSYLWGGGGAKWGRCPAALDLWQARVDIREREREKYFLLIICIAWGSSLTFL